MDNEQYTTTQIQLAALAAVVRDMDLDGFIERICHTESVAPIIDPSLWIKAGRKLEKIKKLAIAAGDFKKVVIETMEDDANG
jgi:hypothetical protein